MNDSTNKDAPAEKAARAYEQVARQTQQPKSDPDVTTESPVVESPLADAPEKSAEELALDSANKALEEAIAKAENANDQYLRACAEMENVRRRSQIDVSNARKYAIERFAGELLTVHDSLDQAATVDLTNASEKAVEQMHEGLALTLKQLDSAFEKSSIEIVIPEVGEEFDPELHQAMSMQPGGEVAPDHILVVIQKGYRLQGRLLRPAMVIVAAPAKK